MPIFKNQYKKRNNQQDIIIMIENTNNKSRWKDDNTCGNIKEWSKRHSPLRISIAPTIYLVIMTSYLLFDQETVKLIIELSYGYQIVIFTIFSTIFVWPFEKFILCINRNKEETNTIFFKFIIGILYSMIALGLLSSIKDDINRSRLGPEQTEITVVSGLVKERHRSRKSFYIIFNLKGKTEKIEQKRSIWEKYNIGDTIAVTYCIGCLNKIVYKDFKTIGDKLEFKTPDGIHILPSGRIFYEQKKEDIKDDTEEEITMPKNPSKFDAKDENSLCKYFISRMPIAGHKRSGWTAVSFKVGTDGKIHDVKTIETISPKIDKALRNIPASINKWTDNSMSAKYADVEIRIAYSYGKPSYMLLERVVAFDNGKRTRIKDGYLLSDENKKIERTLHEETNE